MQDKDVIYKSLTILQSLISGIPFCAHSIFEHRDRSRLSLWRPLARTPNLTHRSSPLGSASLHTPDRQIHSTGHFTSSVHVQYNDRCKRNHTRWVL